MVVLVMLVMFGHVWSCWFWSCWWRRCWLLFLFVLRLLLLLLLLRTFQLFIDFIHYSIFLLFLGIIWYDWKKDFHYSLKSSTMRIKPLNMDFVFGGKSQTPSVAAAAKHGRGGPFVGKSRKRQRQRKRIRKRKPN